MASIIRGLIAGSALLLATACTTPNNAFDGDYVTDYDSCVAAGHALNPNDPNQCYFDGQVFLRGR
ncbi:hypothetical protein [uncultured Parasphingopyxis sp.]|uniref:hypothetical protein n=1 Tax=uncultured Parasphingopyxis sp. TaxID=1547918 RepID=UPI002613EC1F|nr:hypothetical protein [uncultured Parasphingopyxis sp.]